MEGISNGFQFNPGNCGLQQFSVQQPIATSNDQQIPNMQASLPMNVALQPNQQAFYGGMNRMGLQQFPMQFPQNIAMPGIPNYGADFSQMFFGRQPNPSAVLQNFSNVGGEQPTSQSEQLNITFPSFSEAIPAMNTSTCKLENYEDNASSDTCSSPNIVTQDQQLIQPTQPPNMQTLALFWSWLSQQQNACQQQLQVQQQLQQQQLALLNGQMNMTATVPFQMQQVPFQPTMAFSNPDLQRVGLMHPGTHTAENCACNNTACGDGDTKINITQQGLVPTPLGLACAQRESENAVSKTFSQSANTQDNKAESNACQSGFQAPHQTTYSIPATNNKKDVITRPERTEDEKNRSISTTISTVKSLCPIQSDSLLNPDITKEQTSQDAADEPIKHIANQDNPLNNKTFLPQCVTGENDHKEHGDSVSMPFVCSPNKLQLDMTDILDSSITPTGNNKEIEKIEKKSNQKNEETMPTKRRKSVQFFFKGRLEGKLSSNTYKNSSTSKCSFNEPALVDETKLKVTDETDTTACQDVNSKINLQLNEECDTLNTKTQNNNSTEKNCTDKRMNEGSEKEDNDKNGLGINNLVTCPDNNFVSSLNSENMSPIKEKGEKLDKTVHSIDEVTNTMGNRLAETADMIKTFFETVGKPCRTPKAKTFSPLSTSTPAPGKALVTTTVADNATIVTMSIVNKYASNSADTVLKSSSSSSQAPITSPKADKELKAPSGMVHSNSLSLSAPYLTETESASSTSNSNLTTKLLPSMGDNNLGEDLELSDTSEEDGESGREDEEGTHFRISSKNIHSPQSSDKTQIKQEALDDNTVSLETDSIRRDRMDINIRIDDSQYVMQGDQKRWQCQICSKSYTTKHNLVTHILGHNGIKPHMCVVCGKYFKQLSHLSTHMLTHDNIKPHICATCGKAFTQISHLKRHQTVHMESKPHICDVCNRGFTYPSELKAHKEKHIPGRDRCNECDLDFPSSKLLRDHMLTHETREDLTCQECGKMFRYPSQLKDHTLSHTGTRPYMCVECGMDFMKEHHLKAHLFTHTGLKPYKCDICKRGFNQKANLSRHKMIHKNSRDYACPNCDKSFTQPQTLKAHMVVHAEKKPYECQICGKEFGRLHNLQGHMHLHNDTKPFVCFCGSTFTLKGNLCRHKKVKHGINEDMEEDAISMLSTMSNEKIESETENISPTAMSESDTTEHKSSRKQRKSIPRRLIRSENKMENICDNSIDRSNDCDEEDTPTKNEQDIEQDTTSPYFKAHPEPEQSDNDNATDNDQSNVRNRRKATRTKRKHSDSSDDESDVNRDLDDVEWCPASKRRRIGIGSKLDNLIKEKFQQE